MRHAGLAVIAATGCLLAAATAASAAYAPLDQPGPPLDVPAAALQASLHCSSNVGHSDREPVLLVPGTAATFESQFSWNFAVELSDLGIPWCGVSNPSANLGDIQTSAEYDVDAIRYLYHHSGDRQIAIVGHSQGGMQPRIALRFWPDTRQMVADDVGIAPVNQGLTELSLSRLVCDPLNRCPEVFYQNTPGSHITQALNSKAEMFHGIAYTVIYSQTDELVAPADTQLQGRGSYSSISLQQVCPGHAADHLIDGTVDPISWALTFDAINQPGPADPARIPRSVCSQPFMPAVNAVSATTGLATITAGIANNAIRAPFSAGEPPLRCWITATCTGGAAPTLQIWHITRRGHEEDHRSLVHVLVRTDEGGVLTPVPGVAVTLAGLHATTDADGDTTILVGPNHDHTYTLIATRAGCNPAETAITIRP